MFIAAHSLLAQPSSHPPSLPLAPQPSLCRFDLQDEFVHVVGNDKDEVVGSHGEGHPSTQGRGWVEGRLQRTVPASADWGDGVLPRLPQARVKNTSLRLPPWVPPRAPGPTLLPNGLLQLAGFMVVCEGYLGIEHPKDLFRWGFEVHRWKVNKDTGTLAPLGRLNI